MRSFDQLLIDAATMHRGCVCPGQVLGVRMAMLGCQLLGINEPIQAKRLIVYVEIDRCMADAIAAVTGCRLGKRTLKHMDYGKCACQFFFVDFQIHTAIINLPTKPNLPAGWGLLPWTWSKAGAITTLNSGYEYWVTAETEGVTLF